MHRRLLAAAALGVIGFSCHTITEDLPPTQTGPSAPGGIPVIVVPVPVLTPTPAPAATPTPSSPASPGATPTPTPPRANSCGLPPGNGSGNSCPFEHARFQEDVERAIDNVIRSSPSLFDMRDSRCPQGCPRVLNSDGYWDAVTDEMRRLGYCAVNDGEELAVKNANSFNDQYDIISGDGYVRRGAGSYRSTCYPAWF
jgi:hypothetical protein